MQWYYVDDGQQAGPVDETGLGTLVQQGRINAQTLVWCPNMTNWQPYGEVVSAMAGRPAMEMAPDAAASASTPFTAGGGANCTECGRSYPPEEMLQYGDAYVCPDCKPLFFQKIREGVSVEKNLRYAGFWIRFAAKFLDGIVTVVMGMAVGAVAGVAGGLNMGKIQVNFGGTPIQVGMGAFLAGLLLAIIYYVYMHGRFGQTLGKMACGIRVVRSDGHPITYGRALGRYCAENFTRFIPYLGFLLYLCGYLMAAFDGQKRALHDHICDTRVVYK